MLAKQIQKLAEIRERHDGMLARLAEMLAFAKGYKDANKNRPYQSMPIEGYDYSLLDALLFADQAIRTFKSLKITKNTPLPFSSLDQVANFTITLDGTITEMHAQVQAINNNMTAVVALSGSRLQITETGGILADIADVTSRLVNATDQMMVGVSAVAGAVGASLTAGNDQQTELVKDEAAAVIAALQHVETAIHSANAMLERVGTAEALIEQIRANLEAKLSEATSSASVEVDALSKTVAAVADNATKASSDAAVTASKREEVDRLTAQAQGAYKELSTFQATLQATQKNLSQVYDSAEKLTTDFEDQQTKIEEMITKAEKMVSGSTVAGLAKAFDEERTALDKSMNGAFWGFLIGIIFLFITSGALAAYILNVPIQGLEWLTKRTTADPTLAQVLSRAVIVIAPFWMTLFSARRYRSLFDLRQQYSHKYNMAFSMDGFKTQAPEFAESIAAWVFTIVAANPVLPKPGRSMDTPPPTTLEGMVKEVREIYGKVMGKETG